MATPMNCVFNTVNGENTGARCRTGPSTSYPIPPGSTNEGILMRKHCTNATFQVDKEDGEGKHYRLINHTQYEPFKNVDANTKVYMYLGASSGNKSSFLSSIDWGTTASSVDIEKATSNDKTENPNTGDASTTNSSNGLDDAIEEMLSNVRGSEAIDEGIRYIGAPFSFLPSADYRPWPDTVKLGRKYIENIVAEAPLVYIVPGHADYLPELDKKTREMVEEYIDARNNDNAISEAIQQAMNGVEGRYFNFVANYAEYMKYVNLLCRICAIYIGIHDRTVPGTNTKYVNYDWSRYVNNKKGADSTIEGNDSFWGKVEDTFTKWGDTLEEEIFGDYKYLKLYVDPNVSFSESASNSTTKSMVEGLFTQMSDAVREFQFLTGGFMGDMTSSVSSTIDSIVTSMGGNNTAESNLGRILGMADNILTGSKVIFPDIWNGSEYQKSYSLTINLVSPYGDPESIFLNIIMPLMHLIALGFPRQTTGNGFTTPFIIKAFAKGWWSIEMGIIDSITIEKGGSGDAWSVDGLPLEAKVTLNIKDLYTNLMLPKSTQPGLFFNNPTLMEYLAVTCGVDITNANFEMKLKTIISTYLRSMFDLPGIWRDSLIQGLRNKLEGFFKIF